MRLKTSFFDSGIFINYMRRCWPLWLVYFVITLLILPVSLATADFSFDFNCSYCIGDRQILNSAVALVYISCVFEILNAMAVFGYLYQSRSCGLMNSLPIKRETMFLTAVSAGLLPVLAANIISAGIAFIVGLNEPTIHSSSILQWLCIVSMGNLAFFGFAVFCAMLTGSIIILPAVYAVLQLTAYVVEMSVRYLLGVLLFGFTKGSSHVTALSPIIKLSESLQVNSERVKQMIEGMEVYVENSCVLDGVKWVYIFAAAGAALIILSLLMYKHRRMETAGDTVAIAFLKPVFKYCLSCGCALVFSCFIHNWFLSNLSGRAAAFTVGIVMIISAFIGYVAAEMLIQRSLSVFHLRWTGFIITACVLAALVVVFETDLPGLERHIPTADDVEEVDVTAGFANPSVLKEYKNIESMLELHSAIIDEKNLLDDPDGDYLHLSYRLKNGRSIERYYNINDSAILQQLADVLNTSEGILSRYPELNSLQPKMIEECYIEYPTAGSGSDETDWNNIRIDPDAAFSLYTNYILKDASNAQISRVYSTEQTASYTNVTIYFYFYDPASLDSAVEYVPVRVCLDSANTLLWLENNTDIEVLPYNSVFPNEQQLH